ncbi:hypothetical protein SAMN02990966_05925 [Rhodospirillales bacterium URHD0017]|nr:hypothetical protein SAMN02990966_05925 [Rhodospirillales bacterium URHD0017]
MTIGQRAGRVLTLHVAVVIAILVGTCPSGAQPAAGSDPAMKGNAKERCSAGSIDRSCFNSADIADRIVYCANLNKSYVFFSHLPGDLDKYCKTPAEVRRAINGRSSDQDGKEIAALIKEIGEIYLAAGKSGSGGKPSDIDRQICEADQRERFAHRIARTQDVNRVVTDQRLRSGRTPIVMAAGIFCGDINLVGADLTHSLVFDYSIFLRSAVFAYVNAAANLSFNVTYVLGELAIRRSKISGGVYLWNAVVGTLSIWQSNIGLDVDASEILAVQKIDITQTKVAGPVSLAKSIGRSLYLNGNEFGSDLSLRGMAVLDQAVVARSTIGGDFVVRDAELSSASISNNRFASSVVLHESEIRCGINLSNNIVAKDLIVSHASIRILKPKASETSVVGRWSQPKQDSILGTLRNIFSSADGKVVGEDQDTRLGELANLVRSYACPSSPVVGAADFRDNRIEKNICLNAPSFGGDLKPSASRGESSLSFAGTAVGGTAFMALNQAAGSNSSAPTQPPISDAYDLNLDLIGFRTDALAVAFETYGKQVRLLTTGFRFDRLFESNSDCSFDQSSATSPSTSKRLELPHLHKLLQWLGQADTTHPHKSAISAFEAAGADATEIKIQKARAELWTDLDEKLQEVRTAWNGGDFGAWLSSHAFGRAWDFSRLAGTWTLGWLADYGFRPQKAILFIALAILAYTLWISRYLKVQSAVSDVRGGQVRTGWLFVMDHMIPGYNIDEAHFKIRSFHYANGRQIDTITERRLRRTIRLIKFTGVVAALFVAAALKALITG